MHLLIVNPGLCSTEDILKESQEIFTDVQDDFSDVKKILSRFNEWRVSFPESYTNAYISLCLPKLLAPLIRHQLIGWNPLKVSCSPDGFSLYYSHIVKVFATISSDIYFPSVYLESKDPSVNILSDLHPSHIRSSVLLGLVANSLQKNDRSTVIKNVKAYRKRFSFLCFSSSSQCF